IREVGRDKHVARQQATIIEGGVNLIGGLLRSRFHRAYSVGVQACLGPHGWPFPSRRESADDQVASPPSWPAQVWHGLLPGSWRAQTRQRHPTSETSPKPVRAEKCRFVIKSRSHFGQRPRRNMSPTS